ncbi:hypothetical protein EDB84DRAFT_1438639 [Lactarius hengduanensis]|nr:hypothetical protein EDB84DRAFT_1438639 [Lactarius hengduanensis]
MDIDVGGHGGGGGVGLVMSNRRSSAACTVSVVVVARLRSSLPLLPSPRGRRRCLRRHSSVVTAIHRCVVLTVATLGVVLTIVVVILAVTVVVILSVVVVGVVLTPLLPVARLHTHAPGLGHASRRLGTEDPAWLEYRGDERQGKSSKNGFKFSVHTRSAGSVAWHSLRVYASRAGAGSRGRSPVGRNVWAGEVVRFTRGKEEEYLVCTAAPLPSHAHSSAPEPMPGSSGCPAGIVPSSVNQLDIACSRSYPRARGKKRRSVRVIGHGAQTARARVSWQGITKQCGDEKRARGVGWKFAIDSDEKRLGREILTPLVA